MTTIKKKELEEVVEEMVENVEQPTTPPPFHVRMAQLGMTVRQQAKEFLKFDSEVSNISYVYVDSQQYKDLVGKCCDNCGIGFEFLVEQPDLKIETDAKGVMIFIATCTGIGRFFDPFTGDTHITTAVGMGISRGSGYAFTIAQTNAMRNLLTNTFLIPTNDRESDDVKVANEVSKYLTTEQKAEKKEELLEKTKTKNTFATTQYGEIVYSRIKETLKKDISETFRNTLEKFLVNKFTEDGKPIQNEDGTWIVKKVAANKIMSDLDAQ